MRDFVRKVYEMREELNEGNEVHQRLTDILSELKPLPENPVPFDEWVVGIDFAEKLHKQIASLNNRLTEYRRKDIRRYKDNTDYVPYGDADNFTG